MVALLIPAACYYFDVLSLSRDTKAGDSLSCTSPQILNFFVMTKTLGALMRQHAAAQTLAGLSDHRRNAERGSHLLH